jgi:hypothetical protein
MAETERDEAIPLARLRPLYSFALTLTKTKGCLNLNAA